MKDAFRQVLEMEKKETGADRILAASFFRTRPLQLGSKPVVVSLDDRRKTFSTHPRGA